MGFLEKGAPLPWPEALKYAAYGASGLARKPSLHELFSHDLASRSHFAVRRHGIIQFIHTYNRIKERKNDALKWGDEVSHTAGATLARHLAALAAHAGHDCAAADAI
jgi:hypothetical protein